MTFTIGKAAPKVTLAAPPATITYDGTTDVTAWAQATVSGASGGATPRGAVTYSYYAGSTATGTPLASSPINVGTYTVVAHYAGDTNYAASTSAAVTFTIQPAPGQANAVVVSSFQVNDGSAQRSMITSLTVTFNVPVTLAAGAITLKTSAGASVPLTLSTSDDQTYVLTFTGSQFIGHSLANGQYTLTVNHLLVTGPKGASMAANQSLSFFRLFGDSNGDGRVNYIDYNAIDRAAYATRGTALYAQYWYFDYDDNGIINDSDYNHFVADYTG